MLNFTIFLGSADAEVNKSTVHPDGVETIMTKQHSSFVEYLKAETKIHH
jgi:hypothetical protein